MHTNEQMHHSLLYGPFLRLHIFFIHCRQDQKTVHWCPNSKSVCQRSYFFLRDKRTDSLPLVGAPPKQVIGWFGAVGNTYFTCGRLRPWLTIEIFCPDDPVHCILLLLLRSVAVSCKPTMNMATWSNGKDSLHHSDEIFCGIWMLSCFDCLCTDTNFVCKYQILIYKKNPHMYSAWMLHKPFHVSFPHLYAADHRLAKHISKNKDRAPEFKLCLQAWR